MLDKIQSNKENKYYRELFYDRARDAMFDVVCQLVRLGYKKIYIPGYIGWSPREGSGIFDPLNSIKELTRYYYLMDKNLNINFDDLKSNMKSNSIVLVVNYFGFRDRQLKEIIDYAHSINCIVIEDNAHGFYTYHLTNLYNSDFTFFSLHKMFPFEKGGSLIINNKIYNSLSLSGKSKIQENPYTYHIYSIAEKRKNNFMEIEKLISNFNEYLLPLRTLNDIADNVPQTYPVLLLKGDRNKVYEMMNSHGYGVVSLYHTMINELRSDRYENSKYLSQHIMNLPVHQDVNSSEYEDMINYLIFCIKETE